MRDNLTTRDAVIRRMKALETERTSWFDHWREIQEVLLPRAGRFFVTDTNRGERRNDILDDTATGALTILGAGMMYGMTSPARPWVRLETQDPKLMESAAVSLWLGEVTRRILDVFARSNTYRALHTMYEELGGFGVACSVLVPDFQTIIHHHTLTIGEYCLAANDRNEIDTMGRQFQMTVGQIVRAYVATSRDRGKSGSWKWDNVSPSIKNAWDSHQEDAWIPLYHLIEPRLDRDSDARDSKNMPFRSVTIETGGADNKVLNESGYRRFPVLAPRWAVTGNDIYGTSCPGMRALGGIKQLQFEQLRKAQAIDYKVKPPLQAPAALKNEAADLLPGGVTYVEQAGAQNAIRTAFDVQIDLQHLLLDVQDQRQLISSAFFADVFLMMDRLQGIQPRNQREVEERHEEKLLMLGPVVERQQTELLAPLIDITFDACMEAGILPPPPEELAEQPLKFEFTSVLAQAQRRAAMGGVDRIVAATASIAAAKQDPSVWDNLNTDKAIQKAATYEGLDPEIMNDETTITQMRQARQEAMQQAQQAQEAQQAAETAKTLGQAPVTTDNALGQVVRGFATQ